MSCSHSVAVSGLDEITSVFLFGLRLYKNSCKEGIAEKIKLLFYKAKKISSEI